MDDQIDTEAMAKRVQRLCVALASGGYAKYTTDVRASVSRDMHVPVVVRRGATVLLIRRSYTPAEGPAGSIVAALVHEDGREEMVATESGPVTARTGASRVRTVRIPDRLWSDLAGLDPKGEAGPQIIDACRAWVEGW